MITLGDDLRADDDIDLVRLDPLDNVGGGGRPLQRIGRGDNRARARQQRREFLSESLHSGAAREPGCLRRRRPGRHSAMASRSRSSGTAGADHAMLDQPCGAGGAADAIAASAAQGQRRIAAAIEEQQRLPTGGERVGQGATQCRRDEAALRRAVTPQVYYLDRRRTRACGTIGSDSSK